MKSTKKSLKNTNECANEHALTALSHTYIPTRSQLAIRERKFNSKSTQTQKLKRNEMKAHRRKYTWNPRIFVVYYFDECEKESKSVTTTKERPWNESEKERKSSKNAAQGKLLRWSVWFAVDDSIAFPYQLYYALHFAQISAQNKFIRQVLLVWERAPCWLMRDWLNRIWVKKAAREYFISLHSRRNERKLEQKHWAMKRLLLLFTLTALTQLHSHARSLTPFSQSFANHFYYELKMKKT